MLSSGNKIPFPAVELKQALTDMIEAIALQGKASGHILDAESEMLEKAKKDAADMDEYKELNLSVNSIVRSIATLQYFSHYELEDSENLLQNIADLSEFNEMEE